MGQEGAQVIGSAPDTGLAPSPSAEVVVQQNKKGRQAAVLTSKGVKQQRRQRPRKDNAITNKDIKPIYTDHNNKQAKQGKGSQRN